MKLTAIIEQDPKGWYVGQVEELPAAISQGKTIQEVKGNLLDAVHLLLEINREATEKAYQGKQVITRPELITIDRARLQRVTNAHQTLFCNLF